MKTINKAIIPCGGLGTRCLPATKAIPKEIMPVIDTPVLAYIVDELIESGIDSIMIILGEGKEAIRDYFTPSPRLEKALKSKPELYETIKNIGKNAEIVFGKQEKPLGSGDAVMVALEFTANDPFVMCNGDDLIVSDIPVSKQLIDAYGKRAGVVLGVQKVDLNETDKYGIINPTSVDGRMILCDNIVEKPKSNPPSRYAALGRYVLTPEIYERIESMNNKSGEIGITDAICAMMKDGAAYAYEFDGKRYDMGDKFGALTATVDFALQRPEFKDKFKAYLQSVLSK
ncbi:MAG: UTP--glucose-1-phosphate uridylyltransferase [Clostridiales bacterium]|nr:UTP--glucose-1-phosphate uridylyltransferase [Clostridiales bacterium]